MNGHDHAHHHHHGSGGGGAKVIRDPVCGMSVDMENQPEPAYA